MPLDALADGLFFPSRNPLIANHLFIMSALVVGCRYLLGFAVVAEVISVEAIDRPHIVIDTRSQSFHWSLDHTWTVDVMNHANLGTLSEDIL